MRNVIDKIYSSYNSAMDKLLDLEHFHNEVRRISDDKRTLSKGELHDTARLATISPVSTGL